MTKNNNFKQFMIYMMALVFGKKMMFSSFTNKQETLNLALWPCLLCKVLLVIFFRI